MELTLLPDINIIYMQLLKSKNGSYDGYDEHDCHYHYDCGDDKCDRDDLMLVMPDTTLMTPTMTVMTNVTVMM